LRQRTDTDEVVDPALQIFLSRNAVADIIVVSRVNVLTDMLAGKNSGFFRILDNPKLCFFYGVYEVLYIFRIALYIIQRESV